MPIRTCCCIGTRRPSRTCSGFRYRKGHGRAGREKLPSRGHADRHLSRQMRICEESRRHGLSGRGRDHAGPCALRRVADGLPARREALGDVRADLRAEQEDEGEASGAVPGGGEALPRGPGAIRTCAGRKGGSKEAAARTRSGRRHAEKQGEFLRFAHDLSVPSATIRPSRTEGCAICSRRYPAATGP